MYEVKENRRKLQDGTEITTYTRDVVSANILEVEAGTNGYQGGDTGHESYKDVVGDKIQVKAGTIRKRQM